jgi:hypothetical protein
VPQLPGLPLRATWITDTYPMRRWNEERRKYDRFASEPSQGWIWQVEEVHGKDGWERYYGFVGGGRIVRVPAREIRFARDDPQWHRMGHTTRVRVQLRDGDTPADSDYLPLLVDRPPHVRLQFTNESGLPQRVPARFLPESPQAAATPPAGVRVKLYRTESWRGSAGLRMAAKAPSASVQRLAEWPLRPGAGTLLQPGEERTGFDLNLAKWYDCAAPGMYHVEIEFMQGPGQRLAKVEDRSFYLLPAR